MSTHLSAIKLMLYGTGEQEPQSDVTAQLAQEIYNHNILALLVENLAKIEFEVNLIFR